MVNHPVTSLPYSQTDLTGGGSVVPLRNADRHRIARAGRCRRRRAQAHGVGEGGAAHVACGTAPAAVTDGHLREVEGEGPVLESIRGEAAVQCVEVR